MSIEIDWWQFFVMSVCRLFPGFHARPVKHLTAVATGVTTRHFSHPRRAEYQLQISRVNFFLVFGNDFWVLLKWQITGLLGRCQLDASKMFQWYKSNVLTWGMNIWIALESSTIATIIERIIWTSQTCLFRTGLWHRSVCMRPSRR